MKISFNYIKSGYNPDEVPSVGRYFQMRNILEHSWIERLDRRKVTHPYTILVDDEEWFAHVF